MAEPSIVVVGETPSLGRALVDLLEAEGLSVQYRSHLESAGVPGSGPAPVIVVASNTPYCATARRWLDGELGSSRLVVVGSRDPRVAPGSGIHRVSLPLRAAPFLQTVRGLLSGKGPAPG